MELNFTEINNNQLSYENTEPEKYWDQNLKQNQKQQKKRRLHLRIYYII